ncbi:hypothetical protein M2272_004854 [Mycobacterium frederiksbergense]|uniref:Uncharacterized protein n=1 Tax=Mycolicibacterium frederiksbergense TaxID=117567 RepID=A0ABT6L5I3_9MYCO|nr:hypothetical protein [Mycolicibacterium frederiksbergense]MDH6198195.1 hypothetical protein [Mycolicibacterium frederiksbergense]
MQPWHVADAIRRHLNSTGSLLVAQAIRDQGANLDCATACDDAVDHQHGQRFLV